MLVRAGRGRAEFHAAVLATGLARLIELASGAGPLPVIAIDMPIGLPDAGRRLADVEARQRLGPRRSSIFITPVRAALEQSSHASASQLNRELAGEGISAQAYALRPKLLEVDAWVRALGPEPTLVVEVHPESSFAVMAGAPLGASKKSWAGLQVRRNLLRHEGIELPDQLGQAGTAGPDDVLDAAAAAWSGARVGRGTAVRVPERQQRFSDGLDAAIWT